MGKSYFRLNLESKFISITLVYVLKMEISLLRFIESKGELMNLDFDNGQVFNIETGKTVGEVEDMLPNCCYDYRYEADEASIVDRCCECGANIYEGEECYDIHGEIICEDCMDDFKKEACLDE